MEAIDWWDREFGFLSEIRILEPHTTLAPAAHHASTAARGDPLAAGQSVMETIDWWDREFGFLSEIGILEPRPTLAPAAHHVSALTRGYLIGIENASRSQESEFRTLNPHPTLPLFITPAVRHVSTPGRDCSFGIENVGPSQRSEFWTLALSLASAPPRPHER